MSEDEKVYSERPSEDEEILVEQLARVARLEAERGLEAERASVEPSPSDESDEAVADIDPELLRPLDEAFKARSLQLLKAKMRAEAVARAADPDTDTDSEDDPAEPLPFAPAPSRPKEPASPRTVRRSMPKPWLALAAALALAAVALWLMPGVIDRGGPSASLPGYVAELTGERSERRGESEAQRRAVPEIVLGDTFRLTLRPEDDVPGDVAFAFYLAGADGELRPWLDAVDYARSESGSVRIEGVLGEQLEIEPGRWTLVFLYGSPDRLPEPATLDELATLPEEPGWRQLLVPFQVLLPRLVSGELEVLVAGCYEFRVLESGETVCVPHDRLTIWARAEPGSTFEIRIDGEPEALDGSVADGPIAESVPIDGGRRFAVRIEKLHRQLDIQTERNGAVSSLKLRLDLLDEAPWLLEARRLAYGGDIETARELLIERLEASPSGRGLSLLARLPSSSSSPAQSRAQRVGWLEQAVSEHRSAGRWSAMANDLAMLASFDIAERRFSVLRARLDDLRAYRWQLPAEGLFHLAYYRGILENDLGNARGALAALDEAVDLARRLDLRTQLTRASGEKALLLQRLGRGREAAEVFASLDLAAIRSPCERAQWLNNHGWALILGGGELGDPSPILDRASQLAEENTCGASLRLNLLLNHALAHVDANRIAEAQASLVAAQALDVEASPLHTLWRLDAEGRLQMAAGRHDEALGLYEDLAIRAEQAIEPRARWHAHVQRAAAFEALGQPAGALAELEKADALLGAEGLEVPIGAGRGDFLADRELSTRRRLDLLLKQGRVEDAFDLARRSRSRGLESLRQGHRLAHLSSEQQIVWDRGIERYLERRAEIEEQTARTWQLSQTALRDAEEQLAEDRSRALADLDEALQVFSWQPARLPPLDPAETVLLYHALEDGWVGFAAEDGAVEHHRFGLSSFEPTTLASQLLGPFRGPIESARRLRILAHGELQSVDFHALPWGDGVLHDAAPVVYGLDVTGRSSGEVTGALILADARGDLPAARQEANVVEASLGTQLGSVTRLDGDRATLSEVLPRLPGTALLHVAGHSEAAGDFAWQSALLLSGEGRLDVGDVLTLDPAPEQVVLSSCESANNVGAKGIGLGLAQAFIIAGSERVVAATRPVGDAASAELFRAFYDGSEAGSKTHVAERLRQAQLAWRDADPAADWSSYRLLVP